MDCGDGGTVATAALLTTTGIFEDRFPSRYLPPSCISFCILSCIFSHILLLLFFLLSVLLYFLLPSFLGFHSFIFPLFPPSCCFQVRTLRSRWPMKERSLGILRNTTVSTPYIHPFCILLSFGLRFCVPPSLLMKSPGGLAGDGGRGRTCPSFSVNLLYWGVGCTARGRRRAPTSYRWPLVASGLAPSSSPIEPHSCPEEGWLSLRYSSLQPFSLSFWFSHTLSCLHFVISNKLSAAAVSGCRSAWPAPPWLLLLPERGRRAICSAPPVLCATPDALSTACRSLVPIVALRPV